MDNVYCSDKPEETVYLPQQKHNEAEQEDAYDDGDNDDDDYDPEFKADRPLNLNVRNNDRLRLKKTTNIALINAVSLLSLQQSAF